jgi:hypothetical protein
MSADEKYLIPKSGIIVRDPRTKAPLDASGGMKPWTGPEGRYWRRRANDGDITVCDENPVVEAKYERKNFERKKEEDK